MGEKFARITPLGEACIWRDYKGIRIHEQVTEAFFQDNQSLITGLRQISSPNKAQTSFVSKEYVPIMVQPLYKTKRHRCPKRL